MFYLTSYIAFAPYSTPMYLINVLYYQNANEHKWMKGQKMSESSCPEPFQASKSNITTPTSTPAFHPDADASTVVMATWWPQHSTICMLKTCLLTIHHQLCLQVGLIHCKTMSNVRTCKTRHERCRNVFLRKVWTHHLSVLKPCLLQLVSHLVCKQAAIGVAWQTIQIDTMYKLQ